MWQEPASCMLLSCGSATDSLGGILPHSVGDVVEGVRLVRTAYVAPVGQKLQVGIEVEIEHTSESVDWSHG